MNEQSLVCLSPEVEEAIRSGKPIVAMESTIISHGMPECGNGAELSAHLP